MPMHFLLFLPASSPFTRVDPQVPPPTPIMSGPWVVGFLVLVRYHSLLVLCLRTHHASLLMVYSTSEFPNVLVSGPFHFTLWCQLQKSSPRAGVPTSVWDKRTPFRRAQRSQPHAVPGKWEGCFFPGSEQLQLGSRAACMTGTKQAGWNLMGGTKTVSHEVVTNIEKQSKQASRLFRANILFSVQPHIVPLRA